MIGIALLVSGTLLGWDANLLAAIVEPAPLLRAALVGVAVVAALWLLGRGIALLRTSESVRDVSDADGSIRDRDLAAMIRGVRLVFLAVAAFAAAAGWLLAHPLPFVVALIIAGVDIVETSFLLLVVTIRRPTT